VDWDVVLLTPNRRVNEFDCGEPELNLYLRDVAAQNALQNLSRTYVLTRLSTPNVVYGYYTLCSAQIEYYELPDDIPAPAYPIPVVRLVRLAIAQAYQGQGFGALLLIDACRHCLNISQQIGLFGITADAKNERTRAFYQKFGFVPLQDDPLNLFLRLSTIEKLFAAIEV